MGIISLTKLKSESILPDHIIF